jgi:hypothetical protein
MPIRFFTIAPLELDFREVGAFRPQLTRAQ